MIKKLFSDDKLTQKLLLKLHYFVDINSNVDTLESALNRSLAIDKESVDSLTAMTGVNLNEIINVAQELKKLIQDKEDPKSVENKKEKIKNLESLLSQFDWINSNSDKFKEYDKLNDALLTMYQLLKACNVDSNIVEAEEGNTVVLWLVASNHNWLLDYILASH